MANKTNFKDTVERIDNFFSIIGFCFNLILIYLILKKTNSQLRDYRKVLLQNCIIDLLYNCVMFITRTITDYKDGNFFMIYSSAYIPWTPAYGIIPMFAWVFSIILTMTSLPVQFVYRYFLIVKGIKLSNMQYAGLLSISLFFSGLYAGFAISVMWPIEKTYTEKGELLIRDPYYLNELPCFLTSDIREWPLFLEFIFCYSLAIASYLIIAWSSYKVCKYLKVMESHLTPQIREANRQISRTLIMQATLPVFVCVIPITITVSMTFLRANVDGFGLIVSLLFAWIPLVNTLVTICVVKSYRRTIAKVQKSNPRTSVEKRREIKYENVKFVGQGYINLTLNDGLVFQVCSSCLGSVHICYESLNPKSALHGDCSSSQCSLQIVGYDKVPNGAPASIVFGPNEMASYLKPPGTKCGEIAITGSTSVFKNSTHTLAVNILTCQPKTENDVIQLSIKTVRPGDAITCEVEVVGAKIKYPEIITTPRPPASPTPPSSTPSPSKSDSSSEGSFPVWAIIVIVLGFLAVILAVGIIVYCCFKERQSSKTPVSSAFEAPLAVVTQNDAKESTVSTLAPPPSKLDPKVAKAEPALSQTFKTFYSYKLC